MSEVREGYKMTELGEIPVEWDTLTLGDISKRITTKNKGLISENVLTISAQHGLISQTEFFNKRVASSNLEGYYLLENDDFAYNKSYSKGYPMGAIKPLIRYDNGVVSTLYICFRLSSGLNTSYFKDYFDSDLWHKEVAEIAQEGARNHGLLNVAVNEFFGIKIIVPTVEEQQKIASILSTVDEQIDETEQLIVKTKELKKGLMQQLLTKGIGHTEFKQTELGEIPVDWEVKKIGEYLDVLGGYAFKSKDATEFGSRWLKIANVGIGKIKWDDASYLPEEYLDKFSEYQIKYGDIVMAMTRPILNGEIKIAVYQDKEISLLNQRVCKFEILNGTIDKSYFYQLGTTSEFAQNIEYLIAGTDPPNVSSQQIKSVLIRVPSIEEQQNIASILSIVDEQIEVYEQEKAKYEELKKGLMQQLLTGQIRVKI